MAARSKVLGAQSLRRKLKRLPDHLKKPVQDALKRGADVIEADALAAVPVDEGDLAAALHKKRSSDGLGWRIGYWKKGNKRKWKLGGWRSHFIEFGTRFMPARPFLGPAARKNVDWVVKHISAAVNRAFKKASEL